MAQTGQSMQNGNFNKNHLEEHLQVWQGKNRVLVLYAPTIEHPEYLKQLKMLGNAEDGLQERDLVQVALTDKEINDGTHNFLQKALGVKRDEFNVILVGKDGGVKYRSDKATDVQEIFSTIDAMPMRQNEMKERGKQE